MLIHPTAEVEEGAEIGEGTRIWQLCHVRRGARIGAQCVLGRGVFVDTGVRIGSYVKIQNYVCLFQGVTLEDGVFVGPHVCFTNDLRPRAICPDGKLKGPEDWVLTPTLVRSGASIGANSTVVCGVTIGCWAMIGAGSVVTKDVPDYGLAVGSPARVVGYVSASGRRVPSPGETAGMG